MTAPDDAKAIADVLSGARRWCVITGDCLNVLPAIPAKSVDAVVTDPPYGLAFMGKRWDYDVPSVEAWGGCLAAMKPGAHLLAFAGTRTQHRMAVRIEDAGFEIRDMIAWVYGSGFPKSLDVSKAIDKAGGVNTSDDARWTPTPHFVTGAIKTASGKSQQIGQATPGERCLYSPFTDAARQWSGWGTALKPALEPITVARKPLEGTVAENVLTWGTGAMNVDGCRVGTESTVTVRNGNSGAHGRYGKDDRVFTRENPPGRWPANLIHDGSEEPAALLSDAARFFYCAKASKRDRDDGCEGLDRKIVLIANEGLAINPTTGRPVVDIPRRNHHPTVKPTELMRYLCRLVTPNGGVVLDPFAGSGSTGKAALAAGFRFIGIELDPHYADIARRRIAEAAETLWTTESKPEQGSLLPPTPGAAPASRGASA